MRKGFIFNHNLCVACRACSAACMLENSWEVRARNIYSSDREAFKPDPVLNLSLACNHCSEPLCLTGCPSQAYRKDLATGAVIIEPDLCIGCRYCIWNCPYDAPALNYDTGLIEKCHFCFHRIEGGMEPACSSACPTGALSFGEIPDNIVSGQADWFPEKRLNPSLMLAGSLETGRYESIPGMEYKPVPSDTSQQNIFQEWSLILFTFLVTLASGLSLALVFIDDFRLSLVSLVAVCVSGVVSLFHLGNPVKAWRAVFNLKTSPVSREIALFIIFSVLVVISLISDSLILPYMTALAGVALMIAIDNIYNFALRRDNLSLHSGQSFLTGLIIGSFFLEAEIPFLFMAAIKLIMNIFMLFRDKSYMPVFNLRFFRTALLALLSLFILSGNDAWGGAGTAIFLTGELLDRIVFYYDFQPLNIKDTLIKISDDKKTD